MRRSVSVSEKTQTKKGKPADVINPDKSQAARDGLRRKQIPLKDMDYSWLTNPHPASISALGHTLYPFLCSSPS